MTQAKMTESNKLWQAGDFARIAAFSLLPGELICDEIPVYAGQRVIDIGCGTGNTSMSAARRRAEVTGIDPVPKLLATAQERAAVEKFVITWLEGGAESLPVPDSSFDIALSSYGMIFSAKPERSVAEAARVLKPDGRLVLTSWTEGGLHDQLFALCEAALPELKMMQVARAWGREADARAFLAPYFSDAHVILRIFLLRAPDAGRWLAGMKTFFAPAVLAYERLNEAEAAKLDEKILSLTEAFPPAPNGSFFARVPYLEFHCSGPRVGRGVYRWTIFV